jgi:CubicO group peptidase (beta-lactamase class C family)
LPLGACGAVAPDTPVMPYLRIAGTRIVDAVTVYHCLTHTSGIGDDADEDAGEDYEALFLNKPNYSIRETKDFLPQFVDKESFFAPGEGVRYNNVAFVLLGLMIERASGLSYRDYIRQHIFERAGMSGADFCAMDGVHATFAEHYKRIEHEDGAIEWRKNIYSYPPIGSPDGGATVTALDLDRFIRAIQAGVLMGNDASTQLLSPHVKVKDRDDGTSLWNGFAFEFLCNTDGRVISFRKEGNNAGVSSNCEYFPPTDTTVIFLANQDCNVWAIPHDLNPLALE